MASLKETKGRIASVKSTLKITSAMKMVASAKLHRAQSAIENMLPYELQLQDMLRLLLACSGRYDACAGSSGGGSGVQTRATLGNVRGGTMSGANGGVERSETVCTPLTANGQRIAVVAFSSNSSLCGGFNGNVIRETKARVAQIEKEGGRVEVFAVGRKIAESMKKAGYPSEADLSDLVSHSSYASASEFADTLIQAFNEGRFSRVEFIYNHFVSTATQKVVNEQFLPMTVEGGTSDDTSIPEDIILEPSAEELMETLLPRVQKLKVYTVILDSLAAEHAARTVAMQTATDNGNNILQELTLEYNKGRQQKITSEILDIVGGSMQ